MTKEKINYANIKPTRYGEPLNESSFPPIADTCLECSKCVISRYDDDTSKDVDCICKLTKKSFKINLKTFNPKEHPIPEDCPVKKRTYIAKEYNCKCPTCKTEVNITDTYVDKRGYFQIGSKTRVELYCLKCGTKYNFSFTE